MAESLPIYRVLKTKQHRAIELRRLLLDYRKFEKAINAYSRACASAETVKAGSTNPIAKAMFGPRERGRILGDLRYDRLSTYSLSIISNGPLQMTGICCADRKYC